MITSQEGNGANNSDDKAVDVLPGDAMRAEEQEDVSSYDRTHKSSSGQLR